jgi:tricorn protease interacting factor F2/3
MDVNPINYNLTFEPDLKKFTFSGIESITADCKKLTNSITMHCAELKIISCQVTSKGNIIKSSPKTNEKKEELEIKLSKKVKGEITIDL